MSFAPDNITPHCAGPMSDNGRMFCDYRPRCNQLPAGHATQPSLERRMWMQRNAAAIMDAERARLHRQCGSCFKDDEVGTMLPPQYMQVCDEHSCHVVPHDHCGLGTDRRYVTK
jgi:hypothetical protein